MKHCSKCKEWLDETAFRERKEARDGLQYWCRICESMNYRTRRDRRRGVSIEELFKKQGGLCAICRTAITIGYRDRVHHLDHDHYTGKVRGILCVACNLKLGWLEGTGFDQDWVEQANAYIKLHGEE